MILRLFFLVPSFVNKVFEKKKKSKFLFVAIDTIVIGKKMSPYTQRQLDSFYAVGRHATSYSK